MVPTSRRIQTSANYPEFGHSLRTDMQLSIVIPKGKFSMKISSAEGRTYTRELLNEEPTLLTIAVDLHKYKEFQSPFLYVKSDDGGNGVIAYIEEGTVVMPKKVMG